MKFLLVTYNDTDGVGQTVIGLNSSLNKMGHESKTILLHKAEKSNDNVILIKRSFLMRGIFFVLEFLKKSSAKIQKVTIKSVNDKSIFSNESI